MLTQFYNTPSYCSEHKNNTNLDTILYYSLTQASVTCCSTFALRSWSVFYYSTDGKHSLIAFCFETSIILSSSFATSYVGGFITGMTFQCPSYGLTSFSVLSSTASDTAGHWARTERHLAVHTSNYSASSFVSFSCLLLRLAVRFHNLSIHALWRWILFRQSDWSAFHCGRSIFKLPNNHLGGLQRPCDIFGKDRNILLLLLLLLLLSDQTR